MSGFDRMDVAAAVRDLVGEVAKKTIQTHAPRPNYGRVISVNVSSLNATVWFPGDEAPVSVNLFPNTIPGQWHERFGLGSGAGITNTSYFGYGSQVAVEDFDGKVFITDILTGGVLSADAKLFNASVITQEATEVAADQAGTPVQVIGEAYETFINCHISNDTLPDGGAISFGPFTTTFEELPGVGWMEITVTELAGASKSFSMPVNVIRDFEHTGGDGVLDAWFRVVPEKSLTDNAGQVIDFDFDLAIKRTVYGNVDEFFPDNELWMRVVKRGSAWTGLNCKVTIRATNIQRGRSLSGRELFMQESLSSPPEAKGFVGFHNSQMIFRDFDDYGVLDNFGRTIASGGWGTSDSGPVWLARTGAGAFGVDGNAAFMNFSSNSSVSITLQQSNVLNTDTYWDTWCSVMPTGAEVQTLHMSRWVDANNNYQFKLVFQTAGTLTISFIKAVAGVFTSIGTDLNTGITFTANERIRCRARLVVIGAGPSSALFMKVWKPATQREPDWMKIEIDSSLGANAGNFTGFMGFPGGANSNTKPFKVYFDNIRASVYGKGQDNSGAQWHTGPWRSGLLRVATSLQKTWISKGVLKWTGTHVSWGQSIFLGGIGQHRLGLAAGSAMLQSPPAGFTVPVVPNGGTVSVTSDGIPLSVGQALWCGIPPGQTWENLYEYLFITSATSTLNYDLPEWAVLIAVRSDDANLPPDLRLGNGMILDRWRTPAYATNWSDYNGGWEVGGYRMEAGNIVRLRGLIKHTTTTATGTMFTLPTGFRPNNTHIFTCTSQGAGATNGGSRVDVNSSGDVYIVGHLANGGSAYISLASITFEAGF